MPPFLRFLIRRIAQIIPVVIAIAAMNFLLLSLAPGDAASIIAAGYGGADAQEVEAIRASLGLDQPMWIQFLHYMGRLLTLDLGMSHVQSLPVATLIAERVGPTLLLMTTALLVAVLAGMGLGILTSMRHRSWVDQGLTVGSLLVYATPQFWLGLMLIVVFSVELGILPSSGMASLAWDQTWAEYIIDVAWHLILPASTLALFYIATYARLMRASMLEVLSLDFITAARARGVSELRIGTAHAARNAMLPVVTLAGVQIGHALGGQILIETVFGWPGLGRLVLDALLQRDLPTLLGVLFVSSVMVVAVNLIVDIAYGLLDPRIVNR
ncbi:MAG: ABC transporter permease [Acuticoccus sp.]